METTINLYKYNGAFNTVNKKLDGPKAIQGQIRQVTDVLTPRIVIRDESAKDYNYMFVPAFGRYYYITEMTFAGNGAFELRTETDVLKTYENEIMDATATVTESDTPEKYISTRETVFNKQPQLEKVEFAGGEKLTDNGTIIMITIKGTGGQI